jgi:type I restriction enzyme S subunit
MTAASSSSIACSKETPLPLYKETNFKESPIGKIPSDWQTRTTDELFTVETGTTPSTKEEAYWKDGTVNWITPTDLSKLDGKLRIRGSERKVTEKALKESNLTLMPKGSIILSTRAPVGYVATLEEEAAFNQGCKGLIPKDTGQIFTDFYSYYISSKKEVLQNLSCGSTFLELAKNRLEKFSMPLFPISEQRAVVGVLGVVDCAIELADRIIAQTERLKRGLMQQLLTRGIGHTETKQTPIGNIPKEWSVVKLEDIATIRYGLGQPPEIDENGVPMIRATNIDQGAIIKKDLLKVKRSAIPQSRMAFLQEGDIIVVRSGAYTGDIGYITRKWEGSVAGYDLVVSPSKAISSRYLSYYLLNSKAQSYFSQLKSRSAQPHLNSEQVAGTPIILPSLSEQESIANILSTISTKLQYERQELAVLGRIKQSMMDLLLTGKIRIKVD